MDVEPNSVDDFQAQFEALADKALSYGLASVYLIVDANPIQREQDIRGRWTGGFYTCLGAVTMLLHRMTRPEPDDL